MQSCANNIGYEFIYGSGFGKNRIIRFRLRFRMSFHHFELFDYGFEDLIRISNYLISVSKELLHFKLFDYDFDFFFGTSNCFFMPTIRILLPEI